MSDPNTHGHLDQRTPNGVPLIAGPLTPEQKLAQDREEERKAKEKSDNAFQERQVQAVEGATRIAARNTTLTGVAAMISVLALGGTLYQAHMNRKSWKTAQDTLGQMKADSEESSRQFQVQLGHFDAGLGRTGLLAVHAGEQAVAASKTAMAARDTADVARQALDVSNRPWISATITQKSKFVLGPNGASISVGVQLRDLGRTPAIHVLYGGNILSLPHQTWHMVEIKQAERQECNSIPKHFFVGSPTLVPTIFPGQDPPQVPDWPASITNKQLHAALPDRSQGMTVPGKVELVLVACVVYQDSYERKMRHSAYAFALGMPMEGGYVGYISPQDAPDNIRLIYLDSFAD